MTQDFLIIFDRIGGGGGKQLETFNPSLQLEIPEVKPLMEETQLTEAVN